MAAPATLDRSYRRLAADLPAAGAERFTASGVFDKLAGLVLVAVVAGGLGALLLPPAAAVVGLVIALPAALVGTFKPSLARWCAPVYAVAEGAVLGVVSRAYASLGGGIVPIAVLLTAAIFAGCLIAFRTGLVKVTPRFVTYTLCATIALALLFVAAVLGVPVPGIGDLGTMGLLIGLFGLGVGMANLFVDFAFVEEMERRGADRAGEWYGALALMVALVLVYLSVLRILASTRR